MTRPLLACLAAVLLLGCADAPEAERPVSEAPEPAAQPTTPRPAEDPPEPDDVEVPAQLDFALPELAGGQVVGAELAARHVALWFWTPW